MKDPYPFHQSDKVPSARLTEQQSRAIKELWRDYDKKRRPWVRLRFIVAFILALILLAMCGCAAIAPIGMFPREQSSRTAEGVWLGLHTIDTMQTVQIARNPSCFYEADPFAVGVYGSQHPSESRVLLTNVILGAVHPVVSRWFDDHAARSFAEDSDNANLWAVGRTAWYGLSILGTGVSVANNFHRGITPMNARCP